MARLIQSSTPGSEREKLSKAIVITIRAFMRQESPDNSTKDMVAFVTLALKEISRGIDQSVAAWEKRGYWVKADKYRMEWQWTGDMSAKLQVAFREHDWGNIMVYFLEIMNNFANIRVSDKHRMGQPWVNAYQNYNDLVKQ